jgi:hypothetical protein
MRVVKKLILTSFALAATGCATTSSQEEIDHYARLFYFSNLCAQEGLLDRDLAAKGISIANSNIYRSDSARYQASARQLWTAGARASEATCRSIDLQIRAAVDTRSSSRPASSPSYSVPRQTTCSTYFGHTNCTTY